MTTRICPWCEQEFELGPTRQGKAKRYCSPPCKIMHKTHKMTQQEHAIKYAPQPCPVCNARYVPKSIYQKTCTLRTCQETRNRELRHIREAKIKTGEHIVVHEFTQQRPKATYPKGQIPFNPADDAVMDFWAFVLGNEEYPF